MKCKNETCDNQAKGNGKYCSATCKTIFNRNKRNTKKAVTAPVTPTVTPVTPDKVVTAVTAGKLTIEKTSAVGFTEASVRQDIGKLTPQLMAGLAGGVSVPTNQPTAETAAMIAREINSKVSLYPGIDWKHSPEYAELIYRLLTWSKAKLRDAGHAVPAWKDTL